MWKQKIGISLHDGFTVPAAELINIVKAAGFDAVSPGTTNIYEVVKLAREKGLFVESLHAPFIGVDRMWSAEESVSTKVKQEIFAALDCCIEYGIPVLVCHVWIGFDYTFDPTSLYFGNFDDLVAKAGRHGVKIAFENTEGIEYLHALMDRYEGNDTVGFCWDSGHEMCYNHSQDLLALYGDCLLVTHLNDNLGIRRFDGSIFWTDDLHLLPYDGIIDWDDCIQRLKKAAKLDYLNFELNIGSKPDRHDNDIYGKMSAEEYFSEAYKRACRIAYRYSNNILLSSDKRGGNGRDDCKLPYPHPSL